MIPMCDLCDEPATYQRAGEDEYRCDTCPRDGEWYEVEWAEDWRRARRELEL